MLRYNKIRDVAIRKDRATLVHIVGMLNAFDCFDISRRVVVSGDPPSAC